ncbi:Ligand-dependent corepressor [Collichthys lucidus]|uniref:Ligand-dependent corepressor n=1 Tax=Collichthys lucidus TaxID=240159 RepID=A0A4U5VBZ3_COLLU|nr:Ligand-dependent corepressor [Collichthys lucidus]
MASQCKRQQCTIERHGFRQELDSWRHKLIHCVATANVDTRYHRRQIDQTTENGHFVFVYLMRAIKLQRRDKGNCPIEQQRQLSVCLPIHVFSGPSAHRCKLCVRGFLLGFGEIWTETAQAVFENAGNVSYSCLRLACVESILEGLFGPELVEDLKLFKDLEPTTVSDWSFDENCLFCCLRRDKVKEHLIGLSSEGLEDTPKPLLVKDQTTISRLEKQAEEFLNAVLCRKDVPNFSDPHIPVVAREILQRMIRQFAAEYTSKTSSPQDSCSDSQPHSDQSLPTAPLLSGAPPSTSPATTVAGPAHNQNPVLSKLLMADQDAPLDLTIKKPLAVPSDQEKKKALCKLCLHPISFHPIRRSLRADGQVGLFMKSLQDGRRRENIGHSARYKPSSSLAYSLHIKEEADLESDPESPLSHNHSSRPTDLFRNGSASWNSKTHFGALLKLKTNSEASERLKDIPRLLEAAGLLTKSLAYERGNLQEACRENSLSLSQSASFDLKIPQTDPKKSSGVFSSSGSEKEYWPYDTDRQALGGNYPLDSESDLGNKQPRKKRGRYRQYNSDLLEEAIVVVMGGKMSVSKAQTIYGIPHSTLEYKVKERLGTLKHPPKKKLKLISQVEEQDVSRSPERKESQNSQHIVCEKRESASEETGNDFHDTSLSSNE